MAPWALRACFVALVVCAPALASAQEPESETPEPPAAPAPEAEISQQATRLAAEGRWQEAAEKFRAALAIRDDAATRFNLAQAERNVGRLASAQREFARARDLASQQGAADVERLAEGALGDIAPRIPKLLIELPANVHGVEARVDGQRVSTSVNVELDPGRHDLVVTARGRQPFVRAITLRERQQLRVLVTFVEIAPAARRPKAVAPRPRARPESRSGPPVGSVLLAGVGAAAFTTAALLHVRRNDKLEEAGAGCERASGEFVCPRSQQTDPQHRDAITAADRAELARDVLIGVGVGAWAAGALWWVLDAGSRERPVTTAFGPERGGASARLRVAF